MPGESGPGRNSNEGMLNIPQSSRTGASPSDAVLCHILDTRLGGLTPSAEMQSVYSTAPAEWAGSNLLFRAFIFYILVF